MALDDDLRLLGFRLAQERRDGTRTFALSRNRFLTYWLHVPADPEAAMERTESMFAGMNFGHRG
jgi:hypothetical protein